MSDLDNYIEELQNKQLEKRRQQATVAQNERKAMIKARIQKAQWACNQKLPAFMYDLFDWTPREWEGYTIFYINLWGNTNLIALRVNEAGVRLIFGCDHRKTYPLKKIDKLLLWAKAEQRYNEIEREFGD